MTWLFTAYVWLALVGVLAYLAFALAVRDWRAVAQLAMSSALLAVYALDGTEVVGVAAGFLAALFYRDAQLRLPSVTVTWTRERSRT